ncbi:MAG: hypothetical protein C4525_02785 [Desulfarculus sp.]|nr:MAG: hypothetical protein C4525_02785 [Desulfarculus sp.]
MCARSLASPVRRPYSAAMSQREPQLRTLDLGRDRLEWQPPGPEAWLRAQEQAPGPASLCLELLALGGAALDPARSAAGEALYRSVVGQTLYRSAVGEALYRLPAGLLERLLARMGPPAWLEDDDQPELAALEAHLRCLADFPGLSCAACGRQEQAGEGPPDCAACPLPPLPWASRPALRLYLLLRRLPPGAAAALLPAALGAFGAREARLLLERLALIHGLLGPSPCLAPPGGAC